jgi:hypothetical protein
MFICLIRRLVTSLDVCVLEEKCYYWHEEEVREQF